MREQPDTGYRKFRLSYFAASPGCGGGAGVSGRGIGVGGEVVLGMRGLEGWNIVGGKD